MKNTFIKVLSNLLGANASEPQGSSTEVLALRQRLENLEQAFLIKAAELEKVQEIISVLVMTNPHIKISGLEQQDPTAFVSGSSDPDRILN